MNAIMPILLTHFAAACYMTGIIWFVQLIQYRWLDDVPEQTFTAYHARYMKVMGYVVGPAMIIELLTGTLLSVLLIRENIPAIHLNILLLFVIWASTFALQIPCHTKLSNGYDRDVHHRLLRTNWIRTAAWTARSVLLLFIILSGAFAQR